MSKPLYPQILISLMLVMSSCSSSSDVPQPPNAQPGKPSNAQPKVPSNVPTIDNRNTVIPPRGAKYTIYAGTIKGDGHVLRANRVRDTLKTTSVLKDWYVIHDAEKSLLYHGYYPTIEDPKAQLDRQKIDLMRDELGNRPFQRALIVEVNSPDPTAPPEWDLAKAQGHWTLQIAVYKGTPERKQAAVDTVRAARQEGIEAYYYHSETASLVCVGTWPREALQGAENIESPRGADRTQPLMVVPMTNDPELNQQFENTARQGNLQLIRNEVKVIDPTLEAAIKRFPNKAVNGMEVKRVVNGQETFEHSLVLQIPRTGLPDVVPGASPATPDQPAYAPGYRPELPRPFDPPPQRGNGRLRSF